MKLKTSCYDAATGRVELRRFAPVWILYTICLLMLTVSITYSRYNIAEYDVLNRVEGFARVMAVINMGYAFVMAQLLFGDLYTPRLGYAIQALPIPRGGWFGTQIVLGIMGSLIPNLLGAALLLAVVKTCRIVVLWWLIAVSMQFLFFYGLAVLCAVCSGNRFGMLTLYVMGNFLDVAVYWFLNQLYRRLLYGFRSNYYPLYLTPINGMANFPYYHVDLNVNRHPTYREITVDGVALNDEFRLLFLYAAVGIALMWLAMRLFRKRKIERAGDLLAFTKMEPAYLLMFTLDAGAFCHMLAYFLDGEMAYPMLIIGLVVGYLACQMLLRRKINIFQVKHLLPMAGILGAFLLTLVLTGLDVFGLTYRMPKAEDIDSIVLDAWGSGMGYHTADPEDFRKILEIEADALEEHRQLEAERPLLKRIFGDEGMEIPFEGVNGDFEMAGTVTINYALKDGSYRQREFQSHTSAKNMPVLKQLFSAPQVIFEDIFTIDVEGEIKTRNDLTADEIAEKVELIQVYCGHHEDENEPYPAIENPTTYITSEEDIHGLIEAIVADCKEGKTCQVWFMQSFIEAKDSITVRYHSQTKEGYYQSVMNFTEEWEHTWQWLVEHGYHEPTE